MALASASVAGAQVNAFNVGAAVNGPTLTGFATSGAEMVGMNVSWTFAGGGGTFGGVWGDIGGGNYGVTGDNGFSLSFSGAGDTFTSSWVLQNSSQQRLQSIRMNGAPGRTLFDCSWNGSACDQTGGTGLEGTGGSARGFSLTTTGGSYTGGVHGFYSNMFGLNGAPAVGDLFEQLEISFDAIMGAGSNYTFRADTDNSSFDQPPPTVAPEPGTWALVCGLAGGGCGEASSDSLIA